MQFIVSLTMAAAVSAAAISSSQVNSFELSKTLGDSMVLQRDQVGLTTLWGYAQPVGGSITMTFSNTSLYPPTGTSSATVQADGTWRMVLSNAALPVTLIPFTLTFTDSSSPGTTLATLSDLLIGDVFLASGQSNQQLSISMALNASTEIPSIDQYAPYIRVLYVGGNDQPYPLEDLEGGLTIPWSRANSTTMGAGSWNGFSATTWFLARDLFLSLGGTVPIGAVESCVGGTAIRNWCSQEALSMCAQPYNSPIPYGTAPYLHSALYNGMIAPFTTGPMTFKFVLWDQAESDSFPQTPIGYYACQTAAQILTWRQAFQNMELPWLYIHLQPYTGSGPCCLEDLRAAQLQASFFPNVGVASAIDLGDPDSPYGNVHFRNKQAIAQRLVQVANVVVYGGNGGNDRRRKMMSSSQKAKSKIIEGKEEQDVAFSATSSLTSSPSSTVYPPPSFLNQTAYFDTTTNTSTVVIGFSPGASPGGALSLFTAPIVPCPAPPTVNASNCTGFEIIGSDGNTYTATNVTLGGYPNAQTVILTAPLPSGIYGVGSAYAWSMWPQITLYGAGDNGMPVLPWKQALTIGGQPGPYTPP